MTAAIRVISTEHARTWKLLNLIDELRQMMDCDQLPPDEALFNAIFDYTEQFSDQMHHPKEDKYLFAKLLERDPDAQTVIDELQQLHRSTDVIVAQLRKGLRDCVADFSGQRQAFSELLRSYSQSMRDHINKEEGVVIPMARASLTAEDWNYINRAFLENEDPLFSESAEERFRVLRSRIVNLAPAPLGVGLAKQTVKTVSKSIEPVLNIRGLTSHYGRIQALGGIDLEIYEGELVALVGANGAGKTTLLRSLSGIQPVSDGQILFFCKDITHLRADKRVTAGISQIPEGRQVFGPMSVEDNLRLGAYSRKQDSSVVVDLHKMYALFPILEEKRKLPAGTLSGGQQQMLAIARALMSRPKVLLLDEPSMGLAPLLIEEIFNVVRRLKKEGMTIFLVEQNAAAALAIADRGYVIETGQIVLTGKGKDLLGNQKIREAYLGI
ncbi:MAG: branched-chain amino acid transport system ATP-binding protein [Motiliproteus sp.]|jgi:branched-chain amino acid transport system ATP-binding protein